MRTTPGQAQPDSTPSDAIAPDAIAPGDQYHFGAGWLSVGSAIVIIAIVISGFVSGWWQHGSASSTRSTPAEAQFIPVAAPAPLPEPTAAATQAGAPAASPAGTASTGTTPVQAASGIADRVDAGWLDRMSAATRIPRRALAGYAGATLATATDQSGCHLTWTTLAAIAQIESGHGQHGGATLLENGYTDKRILGPALDGGSFASIHDSDGGTWDGDVAWDHAVGPFQFIPQTWAKWGADGNGDGQADPNQIDDAALSAARYLCHSGDLSQSVTWRAAVFSYNHLDSYVDEVARSTNSYSALADVVR